MQRVKITTESTVDLSSELIEKYDIDILPLYINMEDKSYRDGVDVNQKDIFEYVARTGVLPKTSAATVEDYISIFKRHTDDGYSIVHINIGSDLSCCHQNALIAAQEFENVFVVDSANLSTGIAHVVLHAAILAQQQKTPQEIVAALEDIIPKVEASFVIDTLKYLHMGGRCSSVAALGANLLKLKPCIEVKDGKMQVGKKYRGVLSGCIEQYVEDRLKGREDINTERIFVTHTCPQEIVDKAIAKIKELKHFDEIITTDAGCTIANHCGPGTLGILFVRK